MTQASVTTSQQSQDKREDKSSQAAPKEQRSSLSGLLRTLDFMRGEEALKPKDGAPGGGPSGPGLDRPSLFRLLSIVPLAIGEVDEAEGEEAQSAPEVRAPEAKAGLDKMREGSEKDDPSNKEQAEVEQAVVALATTDAPGADVELETHESEGEGEGEESMLLEQPELAQDEAQPEEVVAPVQMKAKPGAKAPAPKPQAKKPQAAKAPAPKKPAARAPAPKKPVAGGPAKKPGVKGAPRSVVGKMLSAKRADTTQPAEPTSDTTPLKGAQCRAAFKWTVKQGFAKEPFLIRRYQVVLGLPANGKLDWAFCQAIAVFQRDRGLKMNGKLAGDTVTRMTWTLKKFHGMDKKGLLTKREVKMAQKKTMRRIKSGSLTWKAVAELRKLLKLSPKGGINAEFLRKVADFQIRHGEGLGRTGYVSANTAQQMRDELGANYSKKIASAAESSYGMKSGWGHSPAATQGGKLACAWAVNEVFKKAVGRKFGDLSVDSVQSALEAAGNKQVKPNEAKPGDVNLIPGSHIGIVTPSGSRSLSNSSSQAKFVYRSALNFPEAYGGSPVVYRVTRLK